MTLPRCCYNNQVLRELENTQLSLRHSQLGIYEWNQYVSVPKMPADLQVFITCWMNESEEPNVTSRSRNIGTKLIAVSSILIDLGKCSVANPFRAKVWLQFFHHSFVEHPCLYIWNALFYAIDCVYNFWWSARSVDLCVICIHLMKNWIMLYYIW